MGDPEKVSILWIDARPDSLLLPEAMLHSLDCRLIKASSSEEAFTCLASEKVALVLLALRMPFLEGFETSRRIKEHERFRQTPIIFLSDVALDSEETFKAYAVGAVDILFRPFDPRLLKAKIVAFIELFKNEGERRRSEKTGAVEINDIPPGQTAGEEIAKRKEIEKRWAVQRLLTRALAEAGSLSEATPVVLRTLCENFGWEMGVLWLTTRKERPLRCVATWHTPSLQLTEFGEICRKKTFSRNEGLPGRIWDGAAPAWIPDLIRDANFPRKSIAAKEGLHAAFGFPIRGGEGVLGVLEFFSHEVRQPDPALLEFISDLGGQLGQFIERCWALEALRERRTQLRLAAESAHAKFWVWDISEDHIYFVSPSSSGESTNESLGSIVVFLGRVHHEDYQAVVEAVGGAIAGEKEFNLQFRLNEPDGSARWYFGRADVLRNTEGGPIRMVGVNVEITEQKRLEENLKKKTAEAEESDRLKSQFISKISHKWRTPISGILGYSRLLLEGEKGEGDPKQKRVVENIIRNADHLITLVKDVLDLAKIEAGKGSVHLELVHLPSVMGEVLEMIKPHLNRKPIELYWVTVPELAIIESDADKIKRLFTELLSNAVRYTSKGTIYIIEKNLPEKNGVEIAIEDTGVGIPPEALPHLFDPFHPGDGGGTKEAERAGFGLRVVKDLVDLLQGEIRVQSKVGKGSLFTVFLPYSWRG